MEVAVEKVTTSTGVDAPCQSSTTVFEDSLYQVVFRFPEGAMSSKTVSHVFQTWLTVDIRGVNSGSFPAVIRVPFQFCCQQHKEVILKNVIH